MRKIVITELDGSTATIECLMCLTDTLRYCENLADHDTDAFVFDDGSLFAAYGYRNGRMAWFVRPQYEHPFFPPINGE
jgi:hypothetical protein